MGVKDGEQCVRVAGVEEDDLALSMNLGHPGVEQSTTDEGGFINAVCRFARLWQRQVIRAEVPFLAAVPSFQQADSTEGQDKEVVAVAGEGKLLERLADVFFGGVGVCEKNRGRGEGPGFERIRDAPSVRYAKESVHFGIFVLLDANRQHKDVSWGIEKLIDRLDGRLNPCRGGRSHCQQDRQEGCDGAWTSALEA